MGVAGSIFEPNPSNFGNQPIFEAVKMVLLYLKSLLVSDLKKWQRVLSPSIDLHDLIYTSVK